MWLKSSARWYLGVLRFGFSVKGITIAVYSGLGVLGIRVRVLVCCEQDERLGRLGAFRGLGSRL